MIAERLSCHFAKQRNDHVPLGAPWQGLFSHPPARDGPTAFSPRITAAGLPKSALEKLTAAAVFDLTTGSGFGTLAPDS
jgi:hypothetical protein